MHPVMRIGFLQILFQAPAVFPPLWLRARAKQGCSSVSHCVGTCGSCNGVEAGLLSYGTGNNERGSTVLRDTFFGAGTWAQNCVTKGTAEEED